MCIVSNYFQLHTQAKGIKGQRMKEHSPLQALDNLKYSFIWAQVEAYQSKEYSYFKMDIHIRISSIL